MRSATPLMASRLSYSEILIAGFEALMRSISSTTPTKSLPLALKLDFRPNKLGAVIKLCRDVESTKSIQIAVRFLHPSHLCSSSGAGNGLKIRPTDCVNLRDDAVGAQPSPTI